MTGLDDLQHLMQQEVSRKDFLRYLGVAFLSLVGVAAMVQNLQNSLAGSKTTKNVSQAKGYGATAYGR